MMRRLTCTLQYSLVAARRCEEEVESDPVKKLKRLLPSSCDILGIVTPGIVGKCTRPSFPVFFYLYCVRWQCQCNSVTVISHAVDYSDPQWFTQQPPTGA